MIKPQDILVLLKLVALGRIDWAYNKLAIELDMSSSEVHAACKRAVQANLATQEGNKVKVNIINLIEFISHGLKYVFVAVRGEMTRGMPTAHAAKPMSDLILADNEPVPVWPCSNGEVRGLSFLPLYKSAPQAAQNDNQLYQLLVLVDAIRGGRARERNIALKELKLRLSQYA